MNFEASYLKWLLFHPRPTRSGSSFWSEHDQAGQGEGAEGRKWRLSSHYTLGCFTKNFFLFIRGRIATIGFRGWENTWQIFSDLKEKL